MKKRFISFILSVIMFSAHLGGLTALAEGAVGGAKAGSISPGFSLTNNTLSNDFIQLKVDPSNGRYIAFARDEDPAYDGLMMLGVGREPGCSYTTIFLENGSSYIYGDSGFTSKPSFEGSSNVSQAQFGNLQVQQVISISGNHLTAREDMLEIKYIVKNTGKSKQSFKLRTMLCTYLGDNNGQPIGIPGYGNVTTEKEFSGSQVPKYFTVFSNEFINRKYYGNFVFSPIQPTKVQILDSGRISWHTPKEYQARKGEPIDESEVSIIWERTLAPGAQEEYVSEYGFNELSFDFDSRFELTYASGNSIPVNSTKDAYLPYTLTAYLQNRTSSTIKNVTCTINLPDELGFVNPGDNGVIQFDSIAPGSSKKIETTIYVKKPIKKNTKVSINLNIKAVNLKALNMEKQIAIYALGNQGTGNKTGTFKYAGFIDKKHDSTARYHYKDTYFDGDATQYNSHLATMSLCLELSSWTSYECVNKYNVIGKDKNGDPIYEIIWAEGTTNTRNLFSEIGFSDCIQNEDWNSAPEMDSIGLIAAYKNIGNYTVVALVVRGGGYYDEWGGNFILGSNGNHAGFEEGRIKAWNFLNDYVEKHKSKFQSELKVWIVGYSRGGAVANLTAGKLTDAGKCGRMALPKKNIFAYTFEAPQGYVRSTNADDSSKYTNIHNLVNAMDIVPYVAPSTKGFGFQRYNKNSIPLLPTLGTTEFDKRKNEISKRYATVLWGIPGGVPEDGQERLKIAFNPKANAMKFEVKVDYKKWNVVRIPAALQVAFGDNAVLLPEVTFPTSRDNSLTTTTMLNDTLDSIFDGVPNHRDGYVAFIEDALSHITAFFMGYNHQIDWAEVFKAAFFEDNFHGITMIAFALVNPLNVTPEKKASAAAITTAELIADAALRQTGTNLTKTKAALISLFTAVYVAAVNDPMKVFGLIYYLSEDNGFQMHWPEVTLAAVMTQDSNYDSLIYSSEDMPQSYRIVSVACPVDVYVYDGDNKLISSVVDEKVSNTLSSHGAAVTNAGVKQIVLPSDESYDIQIKATDDGEMSVSVLEYDEVLTQYTLLQGYQDIQIRKGETYRAVIPEYSLEDYRDKDRDGSSVAYRLIGPGGKDMAPTVLQRGEVTYHQVTLSTSNQKGIAIGGGRYVTTSLVQVEADPMPTVDFLGWYDNGRLVSTDRVYSFPVKRDTSLVARFSEGSFHKLTVKATKGGSVSILEIELPATVEIELTAEPNDGYQVAKWEATSGTFDNIHSSSAVFTMPANDVTVTAVFKRSGPARFEDVAVPSDTFTFKKVWEGGSEKSIDFTLYKLGDTVYHHSFSRKAISETEWKYSAWFSQPVACYVIEKPMEGYITRYENVGVYAEITDRCCDGGTIVNYKVPKTGDDANLTLWLGCVLAGLTIIFIAVCTRKRKKPYCNRR